MKKIGLLGLILVFSNCYAEFTDTQGTIGLWHCNKSIRIFADHNQLENTSFGTSGEYEITNDANDANHIIITFDLADHNKNLWHYFKLTGVQNKTVTLVHQYNRIAQMDDLRLYNPCVITYDMDRDDDRLPYEYSEGYELQVTDSVTIVKKTHTFKKDSAYVSYAPVHTNNMVDKFINSIRNNQYVSIDNIGESKFFKYPTNAIIITDPCVDDSQKKGVWFIAREDSFETGGSLALIGSLRFLLSQDPVAVELRKTTIVWALPIFSQDGVKLGHTNFPLDANGTTFTYITDKWGVPYNGVYHEIENMKSAIQKWKDDGNDISIATRHHSAIYNMGAYYWAEWTDAISDRDRFLSILSEYSPDYTQKTEERTLTRFTLIPHGLYPNALTFCTHNDLLLPYGYAVSGMKHKKNDCIYQDGELHMRAIAKYFGIQNTDDCAPLLYCGQVVQNSVKKGDNVTYKVLYRDLKGRQPQNIQVVIDGLPYTMQKASGTDYSKGVFYTYTTALNKDVNSFYFTASNASGIRRVPVTREFSGPFIIENPFTRQLLLPN